MTTIRVIHETADCLVRCDLTRAESPVEVCYEDDQWEPTQYQCADARHREGELATIGARLLAQACEMPHEGHEAEYEYETV